LAVNWGTPGWLLIATIVVLATVGIHPATRAAQRHLDEHVLATEPSLATSPSLAT
jgi:hypothetical protein